MEVKLSLSEQIMKSWIQHYNHKKYWRYRSIVIDPQKGTKIGDLLRLFYIKRADAYNNASMGTHRNFGAFFETPPHLPHGLNGIIVSHHAKIGCECTIFHQVTIGENRSGAPTIGNHVMIGAGSKIVGAVHIGNYVKIGAGCVVMQDVPDYAVVLPPEPNIIIKNKDKEYES